MSPTSVPLVTPEPSCDDFINHELSATLDSTNAFEGPEKLLEIWFASSPESLPSSSIAGKDGLRSIPLQEIEKMLDLVNCKILSKISSDHMDSYLLSESSLFIFPHKMILKTCGTTTTLLCLEKVFQLASDYLNWISSSVYRIFYSRRSFMFPERQLEIHQSWDNELKYLNNYFEKKTSKAYVVGDLSKDHWYLYINGTSDQDFIQRPLSPPVSMDSFQLEELLNDETFELLMTDLSPSQTPKFVSSSYHNLHDEFPKMDPKKDDYGHLLGLKTMAKTKLDKIFNNDENVSTKHDLFLFDPCGFSSNSIVDDKYYYTLHVTPEHGWSYASFETNLPCKISKIEVTDKILQIFQPGQFCLVYMKEIGDDLVSDDDEFTQLFDCKIEGYQKIDKICYDLKFNYKCLYSFFEKI